MQFKYEIFFLNIILDKFGNSLFYSIEQITISHFIYECVKYIVMGFWKNYDSPFKALSVYSRK